MITPFSLGGRGSRQLSKALEECRKNSRDHSPASDDVWVLCTNNPICVAKYIAPSQDSTSTILIQPMKSSSYDSGLLIPCDGQLILAKRENIQSIQMIQEPGGWRITDTPRIRRLIQMLSVRGINFNIPIKLGNGQQLIHGNDKENWDMVSLESSDFDEGSVESCLFQHLVHTNNNSTNIPNILVETGSKLSGNVCEINAKSVGTEKSLVDSPNYLTHLTPVSVTELSKSPLNQQNDSNRIVSGSNSPAIIFPTSSVRTPSPNMISNSLLSASNISTKVTSRNTPYLPSRTVTKFIAGKPISSNFSTSSPNILPTSIDNFHNSVKNNNTNLLDETSIACKSNETCDIKILDGSDKSKISENLNVASDSLQVKQMSNNNLKKKRHDNHLDSLQMLFLASKVKSKDIAPSNFSEICIDDDSVCISNETPDDNINSSNSYSNEESIDNSSLDQSASNSDSDNTHVTKSNRRKRMKVDSNSSTTSTLTSRPVRSARMESSSYAQRNAIFGSWPTRLQSAEKGSWKM